MAWFLLKNRRHVGPYTIEQLEQLRNQGQLEVADFLITEEDANQGLSRYRPATEILKFSTNNTTDSGVTSSAPRGAVSVGLGRSIKSLSPPAVVASTPKSNTNTGVTNSTSAVDESFEPRLGSFSDEDLMNNEVSRIFTQLVDSADLIKGTNATLAPAPKKLPRTKTVTNFQNPSGTGTFSQDSSVQNQNGSAGGLKALLSTSMGMGVLALAGLALGGWYLVESGNMDKIFKGFEPSNVAKGPPTQDRKTVSRPVLSPTNRPSVPSSAGNIRVPPHREPAAQNPNPVTSSPPPEEVETPAPPPPVNSQANSQSNSQSNSQPPYSDRLNSRPPRDLRGPDSDHSNENHRDNNENYRDEDPGRVGEKIQTPGRGRNSDYIDRAGPYENNGSEATPPSSNEAVPQDY